MAQRGSLARVSPGRVGLGPVLASWSTSLQFCLRLVKLSDFPIFPIYYVTVIGDFLPCKNRKITSVVTWHWVNRLVQY